MSAPTVILAITTKRYEAMKEFFSDIGFTTEEGAGTQLCPLFNSGRGVYVSRGEFKFQLEESTDGSATGPVNFWLLDVSDDERARFAKLGYEYSTEEGVCGISHTIKSPDGGTVLL